LRASAGLTAYFFSLIYFSDDLEGLLLLIEPILWRRAFFGKLPKFVVGRKLRRKLLLGP